MTCFKTSQTKRRGLQFLLFTTLLASLNTFAGDAIRTELLDSRVFNSEIEAVEAMKEHCLAESRREDAEHMGAILKTSEGSYLVTHGKGEQGQTKATFAILRPPSTKIVALWHTHGAAGRKTERFSVQDGDTVLESGLPFYLITPKGEIKMLVLAERGKSVVRKASIDSQRLKKIRNFRGLALYEIEPGVSET